MKLLWRSLAAALLCAGLAGTARGATPPWPEVPYTQYAENLPLDKVLGEFAASFSLALQLDKGVTGTVNGRFNSRNPSEFIERLGGVYGFVWTVHAGTLQVTRASQSVQRALPVSGNPAAIKRALSDMGLLDPRFGWGELPEQGIVLVSGPPDYVRRIEQTLALLPTQGAGGLQVAVYRLRHASVDDRTMMFRDREITTPGLATVLRNLINGAGGGASDVLVSLATPLRTVAETSPTTVANAGAAAVPGSTAAAQGATAAGAAPARSSRPAASRTPSIQADSRLNALIVQDTPERLPLYERLVAVLDVPTPLIEIEALIIDINATRLDELGITWGGRNGTLALGFGNPAATLAQGALSVVSGGRGVTPTTVSQDTGNYLVARIRALETQGEAQIQSRPSVLTVDNAGALIDLSETFYIRTQGERVATVTPVTVGTTLRVTPRVVEAGDGQPRSVRLVVDIEDGAIQDRTVDTLPTVRRSVVSTQALVDEDATLLIGGYRSDQKVSNDERIPVLGAIPLVGALFSTRSHDVQKRERLFMIRPRVVAPLVAAKP
ncbi:type III secretion system outer membrane ring subunit SctC [Aquabacterium sp.]|uniref:type III secretion system outer membrane ring subunit SctC n=1 Tax=Aquabacterium sp. TaxID=1872578 RepID=UPI002C99E3C3|nr:type III secretion system outer membrane ring subunit SctC [Aquabacterium sp.]HSW08472.1 type III secretion system outer membrane ring subunit SctC [Aquabacterium sp.]